MAIGFMCWLFSSEAASGRKSLNKRQGGGDAISPRRAFSLATGKVLSNRFFVRWGAFELGDVSVS
jgi:hypothetical protein